MRMHYVRKPKFPYNLTSMMWQWISFCFSFFVHSLDSYFLFNFVDLSLERYIWNRCMEKKKLNNESIFIAWHCLNDSNSIAGKTLSIWLAWLHKHFHFEQRDNYVVAKQHSFHREIFLLEMSQKSEIPHSMQFWNKNGIKFRLLCVFVGYFWSWNESPSESSSSLLSWSSLACSFIRD